MPDRLAHPAGSSDTPAVVAALHFFLALCLCLQMLAMSPPTAEELPQVEAEIGLLRQAVLLCDQLLAAHGSDQGGGSTDTAATAAATAEPAAARAQSREHGQSGPSSLSAPQPLQQHEHIQQAQGAEVHATAHEQQQEQAGPTAACSSLRDHKRQVAALQQAGMAHPEEGSPRMAGRHPLRGYWLVHRAASWFGQGSCVHQQKITRVSVFSFDSYTTDTLKCVAGRKRRKGFSGRSRGAASAAGSGADAMGASVATVMPQSTPQQPPSACNATVQPVLLTRVVTDGNGSSDDDDFKQPAGFRRASRAQQQQQQQLQPQLLQRDGLGGQQPRPPRNYHEKRLATKARQFEEAEAAFAPARNGRQPLQAEQGQQQQQRQQQKPPPQQQQENEPQHLRCGDAVEVMWTLVGSNCKNHDGREPPLVPYHGVVTAVRQARAIKCT